MGLSNLVDRSLLELAWGFLPALLAAARVAGFVAVAPLFGPEVDWRFRAMLGVMIAAATAPLAASRVEILAAAAIPSAIVWEIAAGALIALPAALVMGAARQAGELVAAGAGFSMAATLDPASGEPLSPLGRLYGLIALAAFLALDGPLRLVTALVESYGGPTPRLDDSLVDRLCQMMTWALEIALQAAAPAAVAIVLSSAAVAWIGKVAPTSNMVVLAPAARMTIGLVIVILLLAVLAGSLHETWRQVL